ncbi:MAG: tripartite tricarboxylate transporter substrate binding protein [Betaproteobacteria bacterium]|nr:tripartite tricarboxylate transporter substrate binding protein [Betaproteobacteria bacterium]
MPRLLAIFLAALLSPLALALDYPSRSVRVVVPYSPGGGADTVSRLLFARVAEELGQPFVIENRGGGGGTIGPAIVAKAPADGYTVLYDATAQSINPWLVANLPYDAAKEFRAVFLAALVPNLLVVHPSVPARTVAEVIALAKSSDGLDWASSGNGSAQHLALELFRASAGVRINHIPYKGGGPALNDLAGGHVKFFFSNASASTPFVKSGQVRAIAHTGRGRLGSFPDLPAVGETLPGFEAYEWNGVFVPAGSPDEVVGKLNAALNRAIAHPSAAERLAGLSVETRRNTPAEFSAFVASETAKWGKVIRESGIRLD